MSFGGGTNTVVQQSEPPKYIKDQTEANIGIANTLAERPFPVYGGARIAGWSPDQLAGMKLGRTAATTPPPNFGIDELQSLARFQTGPVDAALAGSAATAQPGQAMVVRTGPGAVATPAQIAGIERMSAANLDRGGIRDVTAGQFTDADLGAYLNPFTQSVTDVAVNDLSRSNEELKREAAMRASAAGAFGGSRAAIVGAENDRNFLDAVGRTSAGLNLTNFQTAQAAIGADQARRQAADAGNQAVDLSVGTLNTNLEQGARTNNQAAENTRLSRNAELEQQTRLDEARRYDELLKYNADLEAKRQAQYAGLLTTTSLDNAGRADAAARFDAGQVGAARQADRDAAIRGAGLQLSATSAMPAAATGMQAFQRANADALFGIGGKQQGLDQANLDMAYSDFSRQWDYPTQALNLRQNVLTGVPNPGGTTTSQTPYYSNPVASALGLGIGGLSLYNGLNAAGLLGGAGAAAAAGPQLVQGGAAAWGG